jgi:hypothetical protein
MGNLLWIASYPKSGNTWVRAFIENYLQNLPRPVDINSIYATSTAESAAPRYQKYVPAGKRTTDLSVEEICAIRPRVHQDIAAQANGTVFVKTHNFWGEFEGHQLHNPAVTAGAIYVVRNPLDVTISMANYFGYSIDDTIDYMAEENTGTPNEADHVPQVITSWSTHVQSWTGEPNPLCLVLRYEDMLADPKKAFRKIESFLKLPKDPRRLKNAITHSSFNALKAQEQKRGFIEKHENAGAFFRQGRKNQWRGELTDAQIQRIVEHHSEQMARYKYLP